MARRGFRRTSIYREFGMLILTAIVCAAALFAALNFAGERLIDAYIEKTDYLEKKDDEMIRRLQKYLTANQVSSDDVAALKKWVKKHKLISMQVYKDGELCFDSDYPDLEETWEVSSENYYGWEEYYSVTFSDGEADVFLSGDYANMWYVYALIGELAVSFLLFFVIVMIGIQKKIRYIRKLSEEIRILEGGDLDYEISVCGRDELEELAESLNAMRVSFRDQIQRESRVMSAHKKMITEMSHDLRTPLTSILIYTEILREKKYKTREQAESYIEKIDKRARVMKTLSDNLFEYSLISSETEVKLEPPAAMELVFSDILSEAVRYLEENGFQVQCELAMADEKIAVNMDYLNRIMDNLNSNLKKYADPKVPVVIGTVRTKQAAGIFVRNGIRKQTEKVESNHIGLRNVENMMAGLNGTCKIERGEETFQVTLRFPVVQG